MCVCVLSKQTLVEKLPQELEAQQDRVKQTETLLAREKDKLVTTVRPRLQGSQASLSMFAAAGHVMFAKCHVVSYSLYVLWCCVCACSRLPAPSSQVALCLSAFCHARYAVPR